jgi:hypothetical protein
MRVLVTGWFGLVQGEATAGDALAASAVSEVLTGAEIAHDLAWSPVLYPEKISLDDVDPADYTHMVFVCGPVHGPQVADLHRRFAACRRIAVGVSVIDPADPAVTGFDLVLARDGRGEFRRDLSAAAPLRQVPVAGVVLAFGQGEYEDRRRHESVAERVTSWLHGVDCSRVQLDTRLDSRDWRLPVTAEQFTSVVCRMDVVVTTRLHGLVLALRCGVPALAVDPVTGGGKVTAQARAWGWPAVLPAEQAIEETEPVLRKAWDWCLSDDGRAAARARAGRIVNPMLAALMGAMRG